MKPRNLNCFFLLLLSFFFLPARAQLQLTTNSNGTQLAQYLVGSGVTISNVTFRSGFGATGFFKRTAGVYPGIDSGIVLTNGRMQEINSPASFLLSNALGILGDPDLEALVNQPTSDASILEFDFIPLGDSISFRYVFASDEYPDYVCSEFNDVFAFFLSGPGVAGRMNLARVPGTNIPVSINSINSGIPGPGCVIADCSSMGPGSPFIQHYTDNPASATFGYSGMTKVLVASAHVTPCQVYHLKIAISDAGLDEFYDSGVFIEARSLSSSKISIVNLNPVDTSGRPYLVEGCNAGGIKLLSSSKRTVPQVVNIVRAGAASAPDLTAIPASVTIPANDSVFTLNFSALSDALAEGTERLKLYVSFNCVGRYDDSIEIDLRDYAPLALGSNGIYCNGTPLQMSAAGGFASYQWTPAALFSDAAIANPTVTGTNNTWIYCTATQGTCIARDSVKLRAKTLSLLSVTHVNCRDAGDGVIRVSGGALWQAPVTYQIGTGAPRADSTFTGLPVGAYKVYIRDGSGCVDSVSVAVNQAFPDLTLAETLTQPTCGAVNGQVALTAGGGKLPYQYSVNSGPWLASPNFSLGAGSYNMSVRDANGCIVTHPVTLSALPLTVSVTATPAGCLTDGTVTVTGAPAGFQFALDNGSYGASNVLTATPGQHTVKLNNAAGCLSTYDIQVPLSSDFVLNVDRRDTICEGSTNRFTVTGNALQYAWTGGAVSNPQIAQPEASPRISTSYFVEATRGRCVLRDTVELHVRPAPVPDAGADQEICVGRNTILQGNGGTTFSWTPAALFTNPAQQNPTVEPQTTTFYYLAVTDIFGCPSLRLDTVRIKVTPAVRISAGRDTIVAQGQPLQLQGVELSNTGATNWQWSSSYGLNNPSIANPIAILNVDTAYVLTLTTPGGCRGTARVAVKVFRDADIYVPTGFTPNGDGRNDLLRAHIVGIAHFRYLRIFNRWGELVFETSNASAGWDGRIKGKDQNMGTFVWTAEGVDYKGRVIRKSGMLTLIR